MIEQCCKGSVVRRILYIYLFMLIFPIFIFTLVPVRGNSNCVGDDNRGTPFSVVPLNLWMKPNPILWIVVSQGDVCPGQCWSSYLEI